MSKCPTYLYHPPTAVGERHYTVGEIIQVVQPGLIYANNLGAFGRTLNAISLTRVELRVTSQPCDLAATAFDELVETPDTVSVDDANSNVAGDTIAKILDLRIYRYSSGRDQHTRMMCSSQATILGMLPCLGDEPPVTVDWLPWHHTFGGNHNLGAFLYNGFTLYIDEGRPLPGGFWAYRGNLREITTTIYFNTPKGYEELIACAINRSAVIVMPAQPFLDWLHQADPRVPSRDLRTTDIFALQLRASPAALYD